MTQPWQLLWEEIGMNMWKALVVTLACASLPFTALATPVDLGGAEGYSLLAANGNLGLGASTHVDGNVGASNTLSLGAFADVDGDADYGNFYSPGAFASISGTVTQHAASFWGNLETDLSHASTQASNMAGLSVGDIKSSQILSSQGSQSVFDVDALNLGAGQSLTLSGNAGDQFIVNVDGLFTLGASASIVLDGVLPEDVLFNLTGASGSVGAAANLRGTFLAPNQDFQLGSADDLLGARFLAQNISVGAATNVGGDFGGGGGVPPVNVPEPAVVPLMVLGLVMVGLLGWRRRQHG
jgi:hypothetical protein